MSIHKDYGVCTCCGKYDKLFTSKIFKNIMYCRDCLEKSHLSICDF